MLYKDKHFEELISKINNNEININSLSEEEKFGLLKYSYQKSVNMENIVVLTKEEYEGLQDELAQKCPYTDDSDCLCHHCTNNR